MHLYTHCDLAALLLHLEKIKIGIFALRPLFLGPHGGPDAHVKQMTCSFYMNNYILLNFVFEISEYVFSRKEEIQKFPYVTPHQSLPPPPFLGDFVG